MNKSFGGFLIKAGIIAIMLSATAFSMLGKYTQSFTASRFHFFNVFVFVVTAIVHYLLMKQSTNRPQKFINSFMLSITAKLMLFVIVIVAYAFTHKPQAPAFIVSFFIMYIVYTSLEVIEILGFLKSVDKNKNANT